MKSQHRITAAIAFSLLACGNIFAQDSDHTEKIIKDIRKLYSLIENGAKKSEVFTTALEADPTRSEMTVYTQNNELMKIKIAFLGEHGATNEYFYYKSGTLFFAFKTDDRWNFTGKRDAEGHSETLDVLTEYRAYFDEEKIIRALERSVQSTKAVSLSKLISKEKNKKCSELEIITRLQEEGLQVAKIKTQTQWETYLRERN